MTIPKATLSKIYRDIVRCRVLDGRLCELHRARKLYGGWHSGHGQEGLCGTYSQLRDDDYCGYTHRGC